MGNRYAKMKVSASEAFPLLIGSLLKKKNYWAKIQLIHLHIIFFISNLHMHLVGLITHRFTLHFTLFKNKKIVITHVPMILNPQSHPLHFSFIKVVLHSPNKQSWQCRAHYKYNKIIIKKKSKIGHPYLSLKRNAALLN